jgi:hypothetical protein
VKGKVTSYSPVGTGRSAQPALIGLKIDAFSELWSQSLRRDRLGQNASVAENSTMAKITLDQLSLKELKALEKEGAKAIVSFE